MIDKCNLGENVEMAKMSREEYETLGRQEFAEIRKRIDLQILELEQLQMLTAEEARTLEELRSDRIILDSNIEEWVTLREEVDRRRATHTCRGEVRKIIQHICYIQLIELWKD